MSIRFHIKKEGITGNLPIQGSWIKYQDLKILLSKHLNMPENDLVLINHSTGQKMMQFQILKDQQSINVQRIQKNQQKQAISGIISNEELNQMASKARFFMIKSSNQENIQKARQHSVWATTFVNQDKLRSALIYTPHVFLFFATNRSYEIKGLARMERQPSKIPDKALWSGVSNIRLGGNFQIKWIRKKPITSLQIEKSLGSQIKDKVMRLSDGQQIQGELCQKLVQLFQVPIQPYYKLTEKEQAVNKQCDKKVPKIQDILGNNQEIPINFPIPFIPVLPGQITFPIVSNNVQQLKHKQKKKSNSKSKSKKKKRNRSFSCSSGSSSSSYDEYSSSSNSSRRKSMKKKKISKQRKRSRQRSRQHKRPKKSYKSDKKDRKKEKKSKHKKNKRN